MQSLPNHQTFIDELVGVAQRDDRIVGVGQLGSHITGAADEWSDIDLVIITERSDDFSSARDYRAFSEQIDGYLAGWKPDYLGVDMWMALYSPGALHVELKFVARDDVPELNHALELRWSRAPVELPSTPQPRGWTPPDVQDIEDQFWIGMNYLRRKVGRGEYFEAAASMDFIRGRTLLPLLGMRYATRLAGYRRLEEHGWPELERLAETYPQPTAESVTECIRKTIELYVELRESVQAPDLQRHTGAQAAIESALNAL